MSKDPYNQGLAVGSILGSRSASSAENAYRCPSCAKCFRRLDHVRRHHQSHDNQRSHQCHICRKSFNRKDLLDRHLAIHEPHCDISEKRHKRKNRIAQACHSCIVAKSKCSEEWPCKRCQQRSLPCGLDSGPTHGQHSILTPTTANNELRNSIASSTVLENPDLSISGHVPILPISYEDVSSMNEKALSAQASGDDCRFSPTFPETTRQEWNMLGLNEPPNLFDNDFPFDFDDSNLFAMDLDWHALVEPGFPTADNSSNSRGDSQNIFHFPSTTRAILGHEAFKRSPWLWEANSHDSAATEETPQLSKDQEQLLLPHVGRDRTSFSKISSLPTMGSSARDAILLLVQRNSGPITSVQSFPSVQILNFLMMNFVFRETKEGGLFIHMPTWTPDKGRPELLTAMVAAGAMTVGADPIWRLGLAFQERARMELIRALDNDNSIARTLDVVRASILWIEIGLWSGSSRKMEVAESAANNVPTMLRRVGAFQMSFYEANNVPIPSDDGEALELKWRKWVELESFKRAALRAMIDDVQSAVTNMRRTTFSTTDLNFPLPAAQDLWNASSALRWRNLMLAKEKLQEDHPLTILDIIQDPGRMKASVESYDAALSISAAVYCLWSQVASFWETQTLQRLNLKPGFPSMWLESHRQDLYHKLSELRELSKSVNTLTADIHMVCELFSMSLFVSPIDAQKFAGRCGVGESQAVTASLQRWAESDELRYAMWHAGQVLRAARNVAATHIQGFRAISVYQACITLALPLLLASSSAPSTDIPELLEHSSQGGQQSKSTFTYPANANTIGEGQQRNDPVVLNDEEGMQSKSYLLKGHYTPALFLGDQVQPVISVGMIANVMARIFRDNHGSTINPLPPLLARLIALLTDLSKVT